jgi:hypothetical protein
LSFFVCHNKLLLRCRVSGSRCQGNVNSLKPCHLKSTVPVLYGLLCYLPRTASCEAVSLRTPDGILRSRQSSYPLRYLRNSLSVLSKSQVSSSKVSR